MVNYPTILGLPQEDIDRQLYVGVLGLESRVKALENKPKPTPTGTGTVTVTTQYYEEDEQQYEPLSQTFVFLCDTNQMPTDDDSNVVASAKTTLNDDNVAIATLSLWDRETHQSTEVTDIPFGDYYLFGQKNTWQYSGTLTVDGDETVTITLTQE